MDPKKILENMLIDTRKIYNEKKCLFSDCKNTNIISAHTIQKNGPLLQISKNQHILKIDIDLFNKDNIFHLKKIGINQASVNNMFCQEHDNLFIPIENNQFTISEENVLLAAFRSIVMELYKKIAFVKQQINTLEKYPFENDRIKNYIEWHLVGGRLGLIDLLKLKTIYENAITNKKFNDFNYMALEFPSNIGVVSSAGIHITGDFNNIIQSQDITKEKDSHMFAYATVSVGEKVYFIFHWPKKHFRSKKFMDSFVFIPYQDKFGKLIQFFFDRSENTFFSETFWQSLSDEQKNWLIYLTAPQSIFPLPGIKYYGSKIYRKKFLSYDKPFKTYINY